MNYLLLFLLLAASPATDIAQRLARWKPVDMPYHSETLNPRERQEVDKLVAASRQMEAIYWQQSDPAGAGIVQNHAGSKSEAAAIHQRRALRSD